MKGVLEPFLEKKREVSSQKFTVMEVGVKDTVGSLYYVQFTCRVRDRVSFVSLFPLTVGRLRDRRLMLIILSNLLTPSLSRV